MFQKYKTDSDRALVPAVVRIAPASSTLPLAVASKVSDEYTDRVTRYVLFVMGASFFTNKSIRLRVIQRIAPRVVLDNLDLAFGHAQVYAAARAQRDVSQTRSIQHTFRRKSVPKPGRSSAVQSHNAHFVK